MLSISSVRRKGYNQVIKALSRSSLYISIVYYGVVVHCVFFLFLGKTVITVMLIIKRFGSSAEALMGWKALLLLVA